MADIDLRDTVRRVLGGDRDAYAAIVERYQDMLLAFAGFRLPDRDLADEAVQQTFIRAYEQLRDFRLDADFGTWLRTICRFVILAEVKRRQRQQRNLDNARDRLQRALLDEASRRSAADDRMRRLHECMKRLPENQRMLLMRRYREDETVGELALRYGRTVTWVTTALFRVRGMLKRCLERGAGAAAG
jgi:RNA polymerase sigma-70 factor (ECF subfamily)